jgi:hypothetical protein
MVGFSQLEVNAELRPRAEFRRGYNLLPKAGEDPAFFVSQRTRLNLNYKNDHYKIGIGIQDVRVWGDGQLFSSTGVFGDQASIDLNEGWIEINMGKKNFLKIGRQYWSYEDERLLAKRNWNQSSIKYDAMLYKLLCKNWDFHIGLSFNNNSENRFGNDYNLYNEVIYFDTIHQILVTKKVALTSRIKSQNFLYIKRKLNDKFHLSIIALATGMQNPVASDVMYFKGTYGIFGQFRNNEFFLRGSAYYQNGRNISGNRVNAYMINLLTKQDFEAITLQAGLDYISGQDASNTDARYQEKDHFFDIFYGARHKYYGLMDYFNNMRVATANGGLIDIFGGIGYKIGKNSSIGLDYHFFSLQNSVQDPLADNERTYLDKPLGSELDAVFDIDIIPMVNLKGGYSILLPTANLEKMQRIEPGNSQLAQWGWLMLTADPVLFSSKK